MNTFALLVARHRAPNRVASQWGNPMATLPPDILHVLQVASGDSGAVAVAMAATRASASAGGSVSTPCHIERLRASAASS